LITTIIKRYSGGPLGESNCRRERRGALTCYKIALMKNRRTVEVNGIQAETMSAFFGPVFQFERVESKCGECYV